MKNLFLLALVLFGFMCNAQSWESIDYNPDQANLELNPLKGLTPLYNENNGFPHSIRGRILDLGELMNGIDDFNWALFDNFVNNQGNQGRFSYLQVNVDQGKPESQVQLPAFLVDDVPHFYYVGGTNPGDNGVSQLIVDYNDPEMMAALLNFIERFGEKYKDDERVFLVHYGLYGVFGEWGLGYGAVDVPAGENWEMTPENQQLIVEAYAAAFGDKNLLARFPENVPEPQSVGYSDGFYFGGSYSDDPSFQWFFHPKLKQSNADLNWKLHPIGGEVDPDVQPTLWSSFPNENVSGQFDQIQNTDIVFDLTRPTFLFQDHIFNNNLSTEMWDNAIKATKKSGYTFHINEYRLTAANSNPAIEVNIQNKGIAPMYANWEVEFGYLDSNGDVVSLGSSTDWNLRTIQPDVSTNYRSFISNASVADGTHTFVLKIKNPLEDIILDPSNAEPVRFANTTQDVDQEGWLTLGELTISGGNAGVVPVPVTSLSIAPATATMGFDSELQLTAEWLPANPTDSSITWATNRPGTVSVDENGLVTSNTIGGDVIITAYTNGSIMGTANISVELPFFGIPGLVQAEFFSAADNLQVNPAPDNEGGGGDVLGFIGDDTWMEYMVNASEAGEYIVDFRASSFSGDGEINILDNTGTILGNVAFTPATGNYDVYKTYRSTVITLPAGEQILRMDVVASSFNLNWMDFILNPCPGEDPSIIGTTCDDGDPNTLNDRYNSTCECVGVPADEFVEIPALIEAEDFYQFADGGEQINNVPAGEPDGVSVVGFINDDTWLDYAVTVTEESDFILDFRASNPFAQAVINVLNETGDVLATADFSPDTGGSYDVYDIFSTEPFTLPVGNHVLRLDVVKSAFNLNWIEFRLGPCAGFDINLINTPCDDGDPNTENDRYNENCDCVGIAVTEFIDIPALIEAEDFYNVFNIQVGPAPSNEPGVSVLGFIADNTWMEYAVKVSEEDLFVIDARASSYSGDGFMNILNETGDILGTIALVPTTGSYDIYADYISTPFTLPVGYHKIRLDVVTSAFNLNWVDFKLESAVAVNELNGEDFVNIYPNPVSNILHVDIDGAEGSLAEIRIYDLQGILILQEQTSVGKAEINVAPLNATQMIFVQIIKEGQQTTRKIILE